MSSAQQFFDAAGRRRSPATLPEPSSEDSAEEVGREDAAVGERVGREERDQVGGEE